MTSWTRYALAAMAGFMVAAAADLFPPIAWLVIAPIVVATVGADVRTALRIGALWGIFQGVEAFNASWYGGVTVMLMIASNVAVRMAQALLILVVTRIPWRPLWPALAGISVAIVELGAEHMLGRFYWPLALADTQATSPVVLQLAGLVGTPALEATIAAVGTCAALSLHVRSRWPTITALGIVSVVGGTGMWRLSTAPDDAPELRAVVVQGRVPNWAYLAAPFIPSIDEAIEDRYVRATAPLARGQVDLVIWPETAVRPSTDHAPEVLDRIKAEAQRLDATFIVGLPMRDASQVMRNAVLVVTPDGAVQQGGKHMLVPLHELEYEPTDGARAFSTPLGSVGAMLCVESVHAPIAQQLARESPVVLVALANDAGLGASPAGWLHARRAAMRAIETGIPVVHAAQFGASVAFDGFARRLEMHGSDDNLLRHVAVPAPSCAHLDRHPLRQSRENSR